MGGWKGQEDLADAKGLEDVGKPYARTLALSNTRLLQFYRMTCLFGPHNSLLVVVFDNMASYDGCIFPNQHVQYG